MSVSHNFTTQDDQKRLEHSTDGTAALKDFAALPADERKALDGPTLLTQYKSADVTQRTVQGDSGMTLYRIYRG